MIDYIRCAKNDVGLGKRYTMGRYCDRWDKVYKSGLDDILIVRV
jgi:hypothetical protein